MIGLAHSQMKEASACGYDSCQQELIIEHNQPDYGNPYRLPSVATPKLLNLSGKEVTRFLQLHNLQSRHIL